MIIMKKVFIFLLCSFFSIAIVSCQSDKLKTENRTSGNTQEEQPKIDWDVNTATATVTIDNWKYSLEKNNDKNSVRIRNIEYAGNIDSTELSLTIPYKFDGLKVSSVGQRPKDKDESQEFKDSMFGVTVEAPQGISGENELTKKITKISLPDGIETIENCAFSGLTNLKEIKLPDNLSSMGSLAFYGCKNLERVIIPEKLAAFPPDAFEECDKLLDIQVSENNSNLYDKDGFVITKADSKLIYAISDKEKMDIPDDVKALGKEAMKYSKARTIHLPASVTRIEREALSAPGVENIDVNENNPAFAKDGHCLYGKKDKELIAVEYVDGQLEVSPKVLKIGENAMSVGVNKKVKRVIIGKNVKELAGCWLDCFQRPLEYETKEYEFRGTTPPKITNVSSHNSVIPMFCTIYVPDGTIKQYTRWIKKYGGALNTKVKCNNS